MEFCAFVCFFIYLFILQKLSWTLLGSDLIVGIETLQSPTLYPYRRMLFLLLVHADVRKYFDASSLQSKGVLMWEIYTHAMIVPYNGIGLREVLDATAGGMRLPKPDRGCSEDIYQVMLRCFAIHEQRWTFSALSATFAHRLEAQHSAAAAAAAVGGGDAVAGDAAAAAEHRLRDIGALLNGELTDNVRRMTVSAMTRANLRLKSQSTKKMEKKMEKKVAKKQERERGGGGDAGAASVANDVPHGDVAVPGPPPTDVPAPSSVPDQSIYGEMLDRGEAAEYHSIEHGSTSSPNAAPPPADAAAAVVVPLSNPPVFEELSMTMSEDSNRIRLKSVSRSLKPRADAAGDAAAAASADAAGAAAAAAAASAAAAAAAAVSSGGHARATDNLGAPAARENGTVSPAGATNDALDAGVTVVEEELALANDGKLVTKLELALPTLGFETQMQAITSGEDAGKGDAVSSGSSSVRGTAGGVGAAGNSSGMTIVVEDVRGRVGSVSLVAMRSRAGTEVSMTRVADSADQEDIVHADGIDDDEGGGEEENEQENADAAAAAAAATAAAATAAAAAETDVAVSLSPAAAAAPEVDESSMSHRVSGGSSAGEIADPAPQEQFRSRTETNTMADLLFMLEGGDDELDVRRAHPRARTQLAQTCPPACLYSPSSFFADLDCNFFLAFVDTMLQRFPRDVCLHGAKCTVLS